MITTAVVHAVIRKIEADAVVVSNLIFIFADSRDRYKKHRTSERDRDRDHKRRRREEMQQYGEYGAEIRAEYNGDM